MVVPLHNAELRHDDNDTNMVQSYTLKVQIHDLHFRSPSHVFVLAVPLADLAFAISSNAVGKEETFAKIKDAMDFIITYYGADRIRYAVITFGSSSYEEVSLQDGRSVDELEELIDRIPRALGVPNLQLALEKAKDVFDKASDRPEAKKFLVVVMDSKSSNDADEVEKGAEPLEEEGIKVSCHFLLIHRNKFFRILSTEVELPSVES